MTRDDMPLRGLSLHIFFQIEIFGSPKISKSKLANATGAFASGRKGTGRGCMARALQLRDSQLRSTCPCRSAS